MIPYPIRPGLGPRRGTGLRRALSGGRRGGGWVGLRRAFGVGGLRGMPRVLGAGGGLGAEEALALGSFVGGDGGFNS